MKEKWLEVLRTEGRLLTFYAEREEVENFNYRHLVFGLLCTWLVGVGRSWDNPKAELLQHLGIGAVVYVFALSYFLWLTVKPFAAPDSSYRRVLTFVCLTSPPGFIYAIPVERWMSAGDARAVNLIFLAVVAVWRVALLIFYFKKIEKLQGKEFLVVSLVPLSIIMTALTMLHALADLIMTMGGLRDGKGGTSFAEGLVTFLGWVAVLTFLPLMVAYNILSNEAKSYRDRHLSPDQLSNDRTRYENPKVGDW